MEGSFWRWAKHRIERVGLNHRDPLPDVDFSVDPKEDGARRAKSLIGHDEVADVMPFPKGKRHFQFAFSGIDRLNVGGNAKAQQCAVEK